jgi:hypothetical protein
MLAYLCGEILQIVMFPYPNHFTYFNYSVHRKENISTPARCAV